MDHPKLTPAEQRVFERLSQGLAAQEIARELGVAYSTVRTHLAHIHEKFGTTGTPALLREAVMHYEVRQCCGAPSLGPGPPSE